MKLAEITDFYVELVWKVGVFVGRFFSYLISRKNKLI